MSKLDKIVEGMSFDLRDYYLAKVALVKQAIEDYFRATEQMRQTIRTLGRIPEESLSDDARETPLEAFRSWRRP